MHRHYYIILLHNQKPILQVTYLLATLLYNFLTYVVPFYHHQQYKSTKGVKREKNKKVFNHYKRFFELIMRKWIDDNEQEVKYFYHNLHILFCKVSEFHDINPKEWIE